MTKDYCDYMEEISADELYKGLLAHGLFTEKLPPVFTSESFYEYNPKQPFGIPKKGGFGFIYFESMRDINIPRALGIPNPMGYQKLCRCLSDNWDKIKSHFEKQTSESTHKVSRIHIRKQQNSDSLFKMNYKNWRTDDSPIPELLIGKKYVVTADISTCFPSMYTHALCWALEGKCNAKNNRNQKEWFNKLDHRCMEIRNGETHGFLIGPHTSNLLAEIILTVVDCALEKKGWKYVRNIDDYTCYVSSYEDAQRFLTDLSVELRSFDLQLNHKKSNIDVLPIVATTQWVRQLNAFDLMTAYGKVDYKKAQAYLDLAISLMSENNNSAAILNYAIKVLSKKKLTDNAMQYCLKTLLHMAVIFPYLIPLLDEYVFAAFKAEVTDIKYFSDIMFDMALKENNYEALIYIIYFALKYHFELPKLSAQIAIDKNNCLLKMFTWMYFSKYKNDNEKELLKNHAEELMETEFDQNWLFIYETLPESKLENDWSAMKKNGVSFIKKEYSY